jgi:hypothetical protein
MTDVKIAYFILTLLTSNLKPQTSNLKQNNYHANQSQLPDR